MNMKSRTLHRSKKAMKDKEYRDYFVEEHIRTGVPFQIRALREKAGWKQKELGNRANMKQERISVLEDPDYSKFTISTLLKLASAFDVGLTVRFVPFSKVLMEEINLSETLAPATYNEDQYLHSEATFNGVGVREELAGLALSASDPLRAVIRWANDQLDKASDGPGLVRLEIPTLPTYFVQDMVSSEAA